MTSGDTDLVARFHSGLLDEWGVEDCRSIGFSDETSQMLRFEIISSVFECGTSILDVGCGTGDLFGYLSKSCDQMNYTGIDQQQEFIDRARVVFGTRRSCTFQKIDFTAENLPKKDLIVASGSLNYRRKNSGSYLNSISRLFDAANSSLVFNMLDATRVFPSDVIVGQNPDAIIAHCKSISDHVLLVRGYLSYDFTVVVSRNPIPVSDVQDVSRRLVITSI